MRIVPVNLPGVAELVTPFEPREILCAFHDIDGTHSLIRDWILPMALILGWVVEHGLPPQDRMEAFEQIFADRNRISETARSFAVESAGLSGLTQMEWALRCALEAGTISGLSFDRKINREILAGIEHGQELFGGYEEPAEVRRLIREYAPELFRIYEKLLLAMSRDRNLAAARRDPENWRVPGSMRFLRELHQAGIRNYFVTGAVVERDRAGNLSGTMFEEISALGYEIGPGRLLEDLVGSSWQEKLPKRQIMLNLCRKLGISPDHLLIVGDGRSEIASGVEFGAVTVSRLPASASRAREIHTALKTNFIVEKYAPELFPVLFPAVVPGHRM